MKKILITILLLLLPTGAWATFPTTGVLDSFTRSNTGPPPSASWLDDSTDNGLQVVSNACKATSIALTGVGSSYWNTSYGPNMEAYMKVTTMGTEVYLGARVSNPGVFATMTGYFLDFTSSAWSIARVGAGFAETTLTNGSWTLSNGDSVGISVIGNIITVWYKSGAGSWVRKGTYNIFSDATKYTSAGYSIIYVLDTTTVIDDFGGGTYVMPSPPPFPTTPIIDIFHRANNTSPPSSAWFDDLNGLEVNNNLCKISVAAAYNISGFGSEDHSGLVFGPNSEAYTTFSQVPANTGESDVGVRINDASSYGYVVTANWTAGGDDITIDYDQSGIHNIAGINQTISNGDSIGIAMYGTSIWAFYKPSGGSWTALLEADDSNIATSGTLELGLGNDTSAAISSYGGGTVGDSGNFLKMF